MIYQQTIALRAGFPSGQAYKKTVVWFVPIGSWTHEWGTDKAVRLCHDRQNRGCFEVWLPFSK